MSGRSSAMRLAMEQSPHPTSSSDAPCGICAANGSTSTRVRLCKTNARCHRLIQLSGQEVCEDATIYLSLFVVAHECAAANAQHAQKKGAKDCLQSKEQPHGPEKDLSHLMERAKTSNCPFPRNPSTSSKSGKKKGSSQKQAGFQCYTAQDSP